ncbi:MAG TPA: dihydrolipoamide acetyltransferase family protein [Propionicimonas sp.]|nr:dihydrolipoamide acetyltransferase family protein [Propionicimonas sp.]HRA06190.1 dihydrolipoamide acetyltransferase family protein [Propionicimonas sp.]
MAQVVVMPQLGNTVESCLVTTWLVKVGDVVDAATLLCEIETDKSAMEVPSGVAGTVLALLAEEGDDVPVKDPLVIVGEPGENIEELLAGAGLPPVTTGEAGEVNESVPEPLVPAAAVPGLTQGSPGASSGSATVSGDAVSPRARGLAASQGIAAGQLAGTGPLGRVIERDVQAAISSGAALTPGARAGAEGFVPGVAGSGIGGRVTRADLAAPQTVAELDEAPVSRPSSGSGSGQAGSGTVREFPGEVSETPLKGIRKVIAERMMNSLATSAQLTYTATAPASGLLKLRKRLKNAADADLAGVTIGDLVGYATVKTLAKHPTVNAHLADGPSSGSGSVLRKFANVHLGMAVDTPRGLLVPTLRFADTITLREFSVGCKRLANDAIGGSISPDLLSGATFTVSNLGAFGIESFTPLLNVPQVAILGVDAIFPRAVINADGSVGAEQRIGFSLTADHQVIDGADAARFLKDLCAAVADIDLTVLG